MKTQYGAERRSSGSGMQSQDANHNNDRGSKRLQSRQLGARVRSEIKKKGGMNAETKSEEKPKTGRVEPAGDCGAIGRRAREKAGHAENHEGSGRNVGPERLACGQWQGGKVQGKSTLQGNERRAVTGDLEG